MTDPHQERTDGPDLERVVGGRVRHYRLLAGMTAAELAATSGVSAAMVSRIESASTSPSLGTISRLAGALGVAVDALFRSSGASYQAVVVKNGQGVESVRAGSKLGHRYESLGNVLPTGGSSLEPVIVELNPELDDLPMYEHVGAEFLLMLTGAMRFAHGEDEYVLREGDSILLDAAAPHGPVEIVEHPARFLSINPTAT
ncbi:helix-turn-helix domain-containing protein [Microbacterium sp. ZXX196]|uniref:helix-turn-helix domain-containing protein n=1 Tax=Microbacterium sp. ZXX196 TaxID=2609291 RepID=UPI0012B88317|nr:XRE family transcriptional regulator [Microbacterium sp. ZXX196]MTE23948.1 helix-turn-helix domain-containing protein [Microbacterium sp. ZXX196]